MQLKCICLNLWPLSELFEEIVMFLQAENADVIFLQEVFHGSDPQLAAKYRAFSELKQRLGYAHGAFAPAFTENLSDIQIEQGNAILSRYPLTELPTTFFDVPYGPRDNTPAGFPWTPRNLQHAKLQLPHTAIDLFNIQGIWGEDGLDNERRLQMSQTIIEQVKGKHNVILAGDFNVDERTQSIANIEDYLTNIFKGERTTSFNMRQKTNPNYGKAIVDFFFVSPSITVLSHASSDANVSDHQPLIITVDV